MLSDLKVHLQDPTRIPPVPDPITRVEAEGSAATATEREREMGSRLGRRVVHFANLPLKLLMPSPPFDSIREIAFKTIPSASKIEIRRVLESLYGFDVADVHTLNMEGKKRRRGPYLAAKPDYKKAYVTLRTPLSISPELFPVGLVQEEREKIAAKAKAKASVVEEGKVSTHWLDERAERDHGEFSGRRGGRSVEMKMKVKKKKKEEEAKEEKTRFPWSSMKLWK
ncbi:Ribosomal protein L25/L23 protein [Dioscorea alata]|uniref:Ribosomal protein L25/L23 protein n=1 Tax=Dioscorea alata TaxID=55571 RepID=A0ACB7U7E2_DIOAL|nr:Ribosomal protein L25/L23 protein [Dioscorea alata]